MLGKVKLYVSEILGEVSSKNNKKSIYFILHLDERVSFCVDVNSLGVNPDIVFGIYDREICYLDQKIKNITMDGYYSIFCKSYADFFNSENNSIDKIESNILNVLIELVENKDGFLLGYYSALSLFEVPLFFTSNGVNKNNPTGVYFGLLNKLINQELSSDYIDEIIESKFKAGFGSMVILQQIDKIKSYLKIENK